MKNKEARVVVTLLEHNFLEESYRGDNKKTKNFIIISPEKLDKPAINRILENKTKSYREYIFWGKYQTAKIKNHRKNVFEFFIPEDPDGERGNRTYTYKVTTYKELLVKDLLRILGDEIESSNRLDDMLNDLLSGSNKSLTIEVGPNTVDSLFFDLKKIADKIFNDLKGLLPEEYEIIFSEMSKKIYGKIEK